MDLQGGPACRKRKGVCLRFEEGAIGRGRLGSSAVVGAARVGFSSKEFEVGWHCMYARCSKEPLSRQGVRKAGVEKYVLSR